MVTVDFEAPFKQRMKKVKDIGTKNKIKKQIDKIINNPEIGKPMRYNRKGTRELYISPFRLSYIYLDKENKIVFLDLYHKDEQ
ncbi:type II toxin-antitoxin system RelE/ParE family toxin [Candidatus Woesearchaeota archaeon]|nr:type II toxin-antitoxin system RelE/ParE family toxin [Candidatus Woesearchaeota archaeon]